MSNRLVDEEGLCNGTTSRDYEEVVRANLTPILNWVLEHDIDLSDAELQAITDVTMIFCEERLKRKFSQPTPSRV